MQSLNLRVRTAISFVWIYRIKLLFIPAFSFPTLSLYKSSNFFVWYLFFCYCNNRVCSMVSKVQYKWEAAVKLINEQQKGNRHVGRNVPGEQIRPEGCKREMFCPIQTGNQVAASHTFTTPEKYDYGLWSSGRNRMNWRSTWLSDNYIPNDTSEFYKLLGTGRNCPSGGTSCHVTPPICTPDQSLEIVTLLSLQNWPHPVLEAGLYMVCAVIPSIKRLFTKGPIMFVNRPGFCWSYRKAEMLVN